MSNRPPIFLLCLFASPVMAQDPSAVDPAPVPDRLSLVQALSFADSAHPLLQEALARRDQAAARVELEGAGDDLSITATAIGRIVQPPETAPNQDQQDHQAGLRIHKPLYDFGRTGHRRAAARLELDGSEQQLLNRTGQHRLIIAEAFFEVVLADLRATEANEAMSVAFTRFDRIGERQRIGIASELEVQRSRAAYEVVRQQRYLAEAAQRSTRGRLALALGRPTELPTQIVHPRLTLDLDRYQDFDALYDRAAADNPMLKSRRAQLAAAAARLRAARSDYLPRLDSEFRTDWYTRQFGSRDDWQAQISLTVPLYQGDRVSGNMQLHQAGLELARSQLAQEEYRLRQQLLQLWLDLGTLKAKRDLADANRDYREMELDRARTEYQQELRTDLGNSMTETSAARWLSARVEFDIALTIAHIDSLIGQPLSIIEASKP